MIDKGTVRPGSVVSFPINTHDVTDGVSVTASNYAVADIKVYRLDSTDGETQEIERASTTGLTQLGAQVGGVNFDSNTGVHGCRIDLSSNATADFYEAGVEYLVILGPITVDGVTVTRAVGTFRIGLPGAILDTTIATLASQTSFTLTAGPADNNALVGCPVVIFDKASAVQLCVGYIKAYVGSTKTVTLAYDPAVFTVAAKDNICVLPKAVAIPTFAGV